MKLIHEVLRKHIHRGQRYVSRWRLSVPSGNTQFWRRHGAGGSALGIIILSIAFALRIFWGSGWRDGFTPVLTPAHAAGDSVPLYGVYEQSLTAASSYSFITAPPLTVTFTGTGGDAAGITKAVRGYWDGSSMFRFRFSPMSMGTWQWMTSSSDIGLHGKSGSFTVSTRLPPSNISHHGPVENDPNNPYTFRHVDGTPFFLFGDTQWVIFSKYISDDAFTAYINYRQSQGFNYIHGQVYPQAWPSDANQNPDGVEIFTNNDPDSLNPRYFDTVDQRVQYMNEHGIVFGMVFAWANEGWQQFTTQGQVNRYARYLIDRYAAMNVVWIIAGEYEDASIPGGWNALGNYIHQNDPAHRPITIHTVDTSADDFGAQSWHTFVYQQSVGPNPPIGGPIARDRIYHKPVVNSEYQYENDPVITLDEVRQRAWEIVMHGGWFVYGNQHTYHFEADMSQGNLDSPGAGYVAKLYKFFTDNGYRTVQWQDFTRFEELTAGRSLAGTPGAQYVYYSQTAGTQSLDLSDITSTLFVRCLRTPQGNWAGDEFSIPAGGSVTITTNGEEACLLTAESTVSGGNGDLNRDGIVNVSDLGILFSSWGSGGQTQADLNQDGAVNVTDLGILLSHWG